MLKKNKKILIGLAVIFLALPNAYSMTIYKVKSGDYLYKIANKHAIKNVSRSDLVEAIKIINKSELPSIVSNKIDIGNKLAIPTTKKEVENALFINSSKKITKEIKSDLKKEKTIVQKNKKINNSLDNDKNLGDHSLSVTPNNYYDSNSNNSEKSNDNTLTTSPKNIEIYNFNQNTKDKQASTEQNITYLPKNKHANNINEESNNDSNSIDIFSLIIILIPLAIILFLIRKYISKKTLEKERELEIISKQRRDRLMSRISPIVSNINFNEEADICKETKQKIENVEFTEEVCQQPNENIDIEEISNIVENEEKASFIKEKKDISVKEEINYVLELVKQYIDGERYQEAIQTLQDSLENHPKNMDLRYSLLEAYAKSGKEIAFNNEVHNLRNKTFIELFDPIYSKIEKLKSKYLE